MEITAGQFIDKITNNEGQLFAHELQLKPQLDSAKIKVAVEQMVQEVQESVDSGYLTSSEAKIAGLPCEVSCFLQTGIINLPWQDINKVNHFFDMQDQASLKLYLVTVGDMVNVSHLRIDEVAEDASAVDPQAVTTITEMIVNNLEQTLANQQKAQEEAQNDNK
ncbi:hypothetical protein [Bombilactobacillus thymidiniphilus]|uniref:Uncharacterized protein n=1 Tax=Bombilactobacillus thymidiniphilus TaxID=2923363 RepID=A0ABY4PED3_9LACO|nr:hypothetical protein [Bombilactobacillus thymidiniphilus]UQS84154.1 hypothetical protein MOO47_03100 [Bombilactobacillus thymidiniphilus]